jgi:hypothetical protein
MVLDSRPVLNLGANNVKQFALYVGGYDDGGAVMDPKYFLGSYDNVGEAQKKVPVNFYYTIMNTQSGSIAEKGSRDGDGNMHPVGGVQSADKETHGRKGRE